MTLKEKFEDFIDQKSFQKENYDAIKCEQIADDYAIEFVKWCEMKMVFSSSVIHKPTYDKLLLQFKKEKGL
jgi:hypothetical protein